MRTPASADNPVGAMITPYISLARFEGGEDELGLLAMPSGAPLPIPAAHGMS